MILVIDNYDSFVFNVARYIERAGGPTEVRRNDEIGQAGLALPAQETELVLTTSAPYAPTWLVESVDSASDAIVNAGGRVTSGPSDVPVGRLAVVALAVVLGLELFQLTGVPAAIGDAFTPARLVLGSTFVASDLVVGAAGVALMATTDAVLAGSRQGR